jgi:branched-chain amino acid transport system permease protein
LAVVLVGGLDSIAGAIVAGMLLGLLQALVRGYSSPALADVIPFIILLFILIVKPYGLFGLVRIERL